MATISDRIGNSTGRIPETPPLIYQIGHTYDEFLRANCDGACSMSNLMSYALCVAGNRNLLGGAIPPTPIVQSPVYPYIAQYVAAAPKWYNQLVMCCQTKPLNEENYKKYFAGKGKEAVPKSIVKLMSYYASVEDDYSEFPDFAAQRDEETFVQYHTHATSIPSVMRLAVLSTPFDGYFTPAEITALEFAEANPTDQEAARQIGEFALVKASAVLTASGRLPNNWYAGKRAVDHYSAGKYNALVAIIKKADEIANNTTEIGGMRSLDTVQAAFLRITGAGL